MNFSNKSKWGNLIRNFGDVEKYLENVTFAREYRYTKKHKTHEQGNNSVTEKNIRDLYNQQKN